MRVIGARQHAANNRTKDGTSSPTFSPRIRLKSQAQTNWKSPHPWVVFGKNRAGLQPGIEDHAARSTPFARFAGVVGLDVKSVFGPIEAESQLSGAI